jgi:hypothetical protein
VFLRFRHLLVAPTNHLTLLTVFLPAPSSLRRRW